MFTSFDNVVSVQLESIELAEVTAIDLSKIAADEGGYEAFHVVPIRTDGLRGRNETQVVMIWHPQALRAGIAWGADADWTDAASAQDAAERFFGIGGKEMCN